MDCVLENSSTMKIFHQSCVSLFCSVSTIQRAVHHEQAGRYPDGHGWRQRSHERRSFLRHTTWGNAGPSQRSRDHDRRSFLSGEAFSLVCLSALGQIMFRSFAKGIITVTRCFPGPKGRGHDCSGTRIHRSRDPQKSELRRIRETRGPL